MRGAYLVTMLDIDKEIQSWRPVAIPIVSMMTCTISSSIKVGQNRLVVPKNMVDLNSEVFSLFGLVI